MDGLKQNLYRCIYFLSNNEFNTNKIKAKFVIQMPKIHTVR